MYFRFNYSHEGIVIPSLSKYITLYFVNNNDNNFSNDLTLNKNKIKEARVSPSIYVTQMTVAFD